MRFARFIDAGPALLASMAVVGWFGVGCKLPRASSDDDLPDDDPSSDDGRGASEPEAPLSPNIAPSGGSRAPGSAASLADFGVIEAPLPGARGRAARNLWKTRTITPRPHKLTYVLDEGAASIETNQFKAFFASVHTGAPCTSLPECAYVPAMKGSARSMEPMVQELSRRVRDARLDATATADLLATLVQTIPYEIPAEFVVDIRPPALVMARHAGDCDSKSLLLVYLARRLGIGAQLLISYGHGHAMAALAVPTRGAQIDHGGQSYAIVECTATVPIGYIDPRMARPFDWQVATLDWPQTGSADLPPPTAPEPPPGDSSAADVPASFDPVKLGTAQIFVGNDPCPSCATVIAWFNEHHVKHEDRPAASVRRAAWSQGGTPGPPIVVWANHVLVGPSSADLVAAAKP